MQHIEWHHLRVCDPFCNNNLLRHIYIPCEYCRCPIEFSHTHFAPKVRICQALGYLFCRVFRERIIIGSKSYLCMHDATACVPPTQEVTFTGQEIFRDQP